MQFDLAAASRCHAEIRRGLNAVGKNRIRRAVELFDSTDGELTCSRAPDICARRAEKPDQVGDFRLSRRTVKCDGSTSQCAGQKQIFRRANAWDRQKNISIPPLAPRGLQNPLLKAKPCAELCERLYMQIDRPLSQRAPARKRQLRFAASGKKRAQKQNRRAHFSGQPLFHAGS